MNEISGLKKIVLSDALVAELKAEQLRTGMGPQALLRGTRNTRPNGLNAAMVKRWLNGAALSAEQAHIDYIRRRWASFPNKEDTWLLLDNRKRTRLKSALKDTGLSVNQLFSIRSDLPSGFVVQLTHSYFAAARKKIKKEYYLFILKVCDENKGKGYIPLTDEIQKRLKAEVERTGVTPADFIRSESSKCVEGLSQHLLYTWVRGDAQTVDSRYLDKVLEAYAAFPDKVVLEPAKAVSEHRKDLRPICDKELTVLLKYRMLLGILPGKIFERASDIPDGLSPATVSRWLNGSAQNVHSVHIHWVLNRCRELVRLAGAVGEEL